MYGGAIRSICTSAAELWLLLLNMLLQRCARVVEPFGSTALSLILGMLFSCPRMVEPLGWCRYSMGMVWYVVRYGVWCSTVCDIVCWYKALRSVGGLRRPLRSLRKEKYVKSLIEVP